jgi:hypothetical protein
VLGAAEGTSVFKALDQARQHSRNLFEIRLEPEMRSFLDQISTRGKFHERDAFLD